MSDTPAPVITAPEEPGPDDVPIWHGFYVRPITGRFGTHLPGTEAVVEALTTITGETAVPQPAVAANQIGLTTQVPIQAVYITSGPDRTFTIGRRTLTLRHAPAWQLALPTEHAGIALRALAWAGPDGIDAVLPGVLANLPDAARARLLESEPTRPAWLSHRLDRSREDRACTCTTSGP